MGNTPTSTWCADTTSEDALAFAMQAVSGIAVPPAQQTKATAAGKLRDLRLVLSGLSPGLWASNHLEETRHLTGWNFVAIRALSIQAAQASLSATLDPEALRLNRPAFKSQTYRGLVRLVKSTRPQPPGAPLRDHDGDGSADLRPLPRSHPLLQLLRRPNIEQSGAALRFQALQQLALTGSALIWIVRNGLGVPRELYVVPTALATPQPPAHAFPRGSYRVIPLASFGMADADDPWNGQGSLGSLLTTGGILDARDVKAVRWPHPLYLSDGLSPLSAGSLQVDNAEQADRARWHAFKNSPNPGMVFTIEQGNTPSPEELDTFKAQLRADSAGTAHTGKHLLVPEGLLPEKMERSPLEMDFAKSYGQLRDACLSLQGVPPIAAGIMEAGSYAAFYAALKQFTDLTMQPTLDLLAEELTEALAPHHDAGTGAIELKIKARAIEDETILDSRLSLHISARDVTINEFRAMCKPPLPPVPWGNVQLGSEVPQPGDKSTNPAAPDPGAGGPADPQKDAPGRATATTTGTRERTRDAVPGRPDSEHGGKLPPGLLKRFDGKRTGAHQYATTQVNLPRHVARPILDFSRALPASILTGEGCETEMHCTLLYGLHETEPDRVAELLRGYPPIRLVLGRLDCFESPGHDVLHISVRSPDLERLHHRLKAHLPNSDRWPQYRPHVTIAYIKPGEGAAYLGDTRFEGVSVLCGEVIFSAASGARTAIQLASHHDLPSVEEFRDAYGFCPQCNAPGVERERRLGGNDTCANGHVYPSRTALSIEVVQKSAEWDESEHPRDHGKFSNKPDAETAPSDKPSTEPSREKPAPGQEAEHEPMPHQQWDAKVERIDREHEEKVARWEAEVAALDAAYEQAYEAWQMEVDRLEGNHQAEVEAFEAREEDRSRRRDSLQRAADMEVNEREVLQEAVGQREAAARDFSQRIDHEDPRTPARAAGELGAAYAGAFRDAYVATADGLLAEAGLDEVNRGRVTAAANRGAAALERAGRQVARAAEAHARASEAWNALEEVELPEGPDSTEDTPENDRLWEEYEQAQEKFEAFQEKRDELQALAEETSAELVEALDALESVWDEQAEKVRAMAARAIERLEKLIDREEGQDTQPDEPEYPPEPDAPAYPDEPEHPGYPDEPEETENPEDGDAAEMEETRPVKRARGRKPPRTAPQSPVVPHRKRRRVIRDPSGNIVELVDTVELWPNARAALAGASLEE